jgi:predicted TIM-barrel fold metal-dependent hydrolase
MWSRAYLERALEIVGPERILFSTDFPYQYRPGRSFLLDTDLSQEVREAFAHGNWEKLTSRSFP